MILLSQFYKSNIQEFLLRYTKHKLFAKTLSDWCSHAGVTCKLKSSKM